jgi:hypothetical protein
MRGTDPARDGENRRALAGDETAGSGSIPRVPAGHRDPAEGTHHPSVAGSIPAGPTPTPQAFGVAPSWFIVRLQHGTRALEGMVRDALEVGH